MRRKWLVGLLALTPLLMGATYNTQNVEMVETVATHAKVHFGSTISSATGWGTGMLMSPDGNKIWTINLSGTMMANDYIMVTSSPTFNINGKNITYKQKVNSLPATLSNIGHYTIFLTLYTNGAPGKRKVCLNWIQSTGGNFFHDVCPKVGTVPQLPPPTTPSKAGAACTTGNTLVVGQNGSYTCVPNAPGALAPTTNTATTTGTGTTALLSQINTLLSQMNSLLSQLQQLTGP